MDYNIYSLNDFLKLFGNYPHPLQQYRQPIQQKWNGQTAFDLATEIKNRRAKIEEEQKALEEAEKEYQDQLKKIRYIADDDKIELLIPREKMVKLISGLTEAINNNKDAKSYKVTINL